MCDNVFLLTAAMEYRDLFIKAMAVWSESGCIRFEPISDVDIDITEEDYIVFTDTAGYVCMYAYMCVYTLFTSVCVYM